MKTWIALDAGTTHIKSILFREDGEILAQEKAETPLEQSEEGSRYQPFVIWETVKSQLLSLTEQAKGTCAGIGITGMAEAGLIVNRETGLEESDIIPWFDRRTAALAEAVSAEQDDKNFARTGLRNSYKYGIYKFLWLLEHNNLEKDRAVWLSMCDYLVFKLTGCLVTDPSFAARTYVYDMVKGCWDIRRITDYGLTEDNFPKVIPSGLAAGCWKEYGIPVAVAGHDHICAAFGVLGEDPEGICDSAGTSETYIGILADIRNGIKKENGMLYGPFVDGGWYFMANVPSSGHSVEWFRKKVQAQPLEYGEMNEALLALEREPTGILYYPYLTGMGSPYYDASCTGALLGLREEHDCHTVLKGILEGIQYQAAWLFGLLKETHGIGAEHLICAGGAVHNKALMQLKADILGMPVLIPRIGEATLAGAAALLIKRQAGRKSLNQFRKGAFSIAEHYRPDGELHRKYQEIWENHFIKIIEILGKEAWHSMEEKQDYDKSR